MAKQKTAHNGKSVSAVQNLPQNIADTGIILPNYCEYRQYLQYRTPKHSELRQYKRTESETLRVYSQYGQYRTMTYCQYSQCEQYRTLAVSTAYAQRLHAVLPAEKLISVSVILGVHWEYTGSIEYMLQCCEYSQYESTNGQSAAHHGNNIRSI